MVGESFSEIFFGNSVALGMPCVTAAHDAIDGLMKAVTADPKLAVTIDLTDMRLSAGDRSFAIGLPSAARDSFRDGSWDATGLLLDRYEEVEAVAARLPYINGFA